MLDGLSDFLRISQPQGGERYLLPLVLHVHQLLEDGVDGMVVIGGEQHCPLVEKGRDDGVDDGIGLACARRALDVGYGVFHGVVDGQELVQIDLAVQQGKGIALPPDRAVQQVAEKGPDGHRRPLLADHLDDRLVFPVEV